MQQIFSHRTNAIDIAARRSVDGRGRFPAPRSRSREFPIFVPVRLPRDVRTPVGLFFFFIGGCFIFYIYPCGEGGREFT